MALILLDAGVVGLPIAEANNRDAQPRDEGQAARAWFSSSETIHSFVIADVTRYEVLRGLLLKGSSAKLRRLNDLLARTIALTIDGATWERAAHIWAEVRKRGLPTAHDQSLDGDAVLAAVASLLAEAGDPVVVATTNVRHLDRLGTDARGWRDI